MYVTDAVILTDLAANLKLASSALLISKGMFWPGSVTFHHAIVFDDIVIALTRRGYTLAQIQSWDQGPTRERAITVYRCLEANKALAAASADFVKRAQEYESDLRRTDLFIGGNLSEPGGAPGQVSSGTQEAFQHLGRYYPERIFRHGEGDQWDRRG